VDIERRILRAGDYAAIQDDCILAVVERKTLTDFADSIVDGSLGFAMAELAAGVPRAAIAVEGSYAALLRYPHTRTHFLAVLVARLQVRYPTVAVNFLESRRIAEYWTYRFLSAAYGPAELPLLRAE
jgi:ERCC4-type nuclease